MVGSALAVPILRHDTLFGIIILMHSLPSQFSQTTVNIVQQAADQMALAIENAMLFRKLKQSKISLEKAKHSIEKYSRALNDELEQGKKIQKNFLPHNLPKVTNCEISSYFHPALHLSGDFYDIFELPENHIGFVLGDVSGKGVGAALFMALTRSFVRILSGASLVEDNLNSCTDNHGNFSPEHALQAVFLTNEYLAEQHCEHGMFVTLFFGIINQSTGQVYYINGGHEPVLCIEKNIIKQSLKATGPVLGPVQGAVYEIKTIQMHTGDLLFGFTDGVAEARSEIRDFYTRARLENIIKNSFYDSSETLLETIKSDLFAFVGNAYQSDDITMLAIKWYS